MADIGDWIRAKLVAHAGTQAIVSGRIYPIRAPQGAVYPLVVYEPVGGEPYHNMGVDAVVVADDVQVSAWAATYEAARALAAQVKAGLSRTAGTLASVTVHDVFREGRPSDEYSEALQKYRRIQDYTLFYEEP